MLYDVFVCHASADKASFVRLLVDALREQHVEVWYDEKSLGLLETCSAFPDLLAEYAPQLTIPGFGGELESQIEEAFRKSPGEDEWALRRENFAEDPEQAAYSYFHGGMFGPEVSPYEDADHAFWLLSSASAWLPARVRSVLLDGMKNNTLWLWHKPWSNGTLPKAVFSTKGTTFKWNTTIELDVRNRIKQTITLLGSGIV